MPNIMDRLWIFIPGGDRGYGRAIAVDRLTTAQEACRFAAIPAEVSGETLASGLAIF